MLTVLVRWVLGHRGPTVGILLGVLLFAGLGASRLRLDFSSRSFFADEDQRAARLAAFERTWGPDDNLLFVVVHDPSGDHLWDPVHLRILHQLAEAAASVDGVAEVTDLTTFPLRTPNPARPPPTVLDVAASDRSPPPADTLPFVPQLLAKDFRTAAIAVRLTTGSDDLGTIVPRIDAVRHRLAQVDVDGLAWELGGVPAVRAAFFALTLRDQMRFVPASLALTALCLAVLLRSVHGVVIPLVAALIPTFMILGFMGWVGEPIGLLNQAYFTLIPVIAVADAVHMVVRVQRAAQTIPSAADPDADRLFRAILTGVTGVGRACLLTSLTTGIGLASLGLASMPTIRRFGLFAALAIGFAYLTVVVVVPLLLSYAKARAVSRPRPPPAWLGRCASLAIRRPWAIVLISVVLLGVAGWGARSVVVDNALTGLLAPDHPVSDANARLDRTLGGSLAVELELSGAQSDLTSPATAAAVRSFAAWAQNDPAVRSVRRTDPLRTELRDGTAVARVTVGVRDRGARRFQDLAARTETAMQKRLPPEVEAIATGTPLLAYEGINRMADDLRTSLAAAFVVIAVTIGFLFRSLRLAVLSMVPNAMPLVFAYGAMGLLDIDLDPLGGVVLTLALGIAVDDTVHLLARVREEQRRSFADGTTALHTAVQETGMALTITTVALAVGMAVNLGSSFPPLVLLGGLGTATIVMALGCDVFVLPALLTLAWRPPAGLDSPAGSGSPTTR